MFPLPWSGIASIWHSGSSQAPWGTARSPPMRWPSAPESPHLSVHVSTSASSCSLGTPSPRMCTLCGLHTTTFSAGLPIGFFAVDAGRVEIPSATFIAEGLLPWLQPYTVLGWYLFHWWWKHRGNVTMLVNRYPSIVESFIAGPMRKTYRISLNLSSGNMKLAVLLLLKTCSRIHR